MDDVALDKSKLECKVCHSTSVCIFWCHAHILYVHSTSSRLSWSCIHLAWSPIWYMSKHWTWLTSALWMRWWEHSPQENYAIVLATSKQWLEITFLNLPQISKAITLLVHRWRWSWRNSVMLPPWIVITSCLDQSDLYVIKMKTMNNIMALKNHSNSNSLWKQIPRAVKRQGVCFRISIDLLDSVVKLVNVRVLKEMWRILIMSNHVKHTKDLMRMACHAS